MGDTGIFTTSVNVIAKAGAGASAISALDTWINKIVLQQENYVNCILKKKITAAVFAALSTDVKYLISDLSENLCAIYVIFYNMAGYSSRTEAELMIKVLYRRAMDDIKLLESEDIQKFMGV